MALTSSSSLLCSLGALLLARDYGVCVGVRAGGEDEARAGRLAQLTHISSTFTNEEAMVLRLDAELNRVACVKTTSY